MNLTKQLLNDGEIVKRVARETLNRTFNFSELQIETFETNFDILLMGAIYEYEQKIKVEK